MRFTLEFTDGHNIIPMAWADEEWQLHEKMDELIAFWGRDNVWIVDTLMEILVG
jgi:rhamnogalacturonyl hydrolase YesR